MPQCAYIRDYMIARRVPSALTVRSNQKLTIVTRQGFGGGDPGIGLKNPALFFSFERERSFNFLLLANQLASQKTAVVASTFVICTHTHMQVRPGRGGKGTRSEEEELYCILLKGSGLILAACQASHTRSRIDAPDNRFLEAIKISPHPSISIHSYSLPVLSLDSPFIILHEAEAGALGPSFFFFLLFLRLDMHVVLFNLPKKLPLAKTPIQSYQLISMGRDRRNFFD